MKVEDKLPHASTYNTWCFGARHRQKNSSTYRAHVFQPQEMSRTTWLWKAVGDNERGPLHQKRLKHLAKRMQHPNILITRSSVAVLHNTTGIIWKYYTCTVYAKLYREVWQQSTLVG